VQGVILGPQGSFKFKVSEASTRNPDGSLSTSGTGKITSGTSLYTGASGSLTETGTAHPGGTPRVPSTTAQLKGKLKY
jgi:hypothetical protein